MKALLFGALLGLALVLWPSTLQIAVASLAYLLAQPLVLSFVLGVLARPALARRWTR
ncbi:hypothetical protein ACH4GE_06835 [Streptomyces tendae]|uniref:hypothetical protein n=1 Tax=Streptomyces tendae TaxID=1932 RepID=UPI00167BCDDE|nr:hypothetical protein [Streptomyces tendae]GHA61012.1 hypothetical protein GCM10010330_11030 [Streptomyces tendae]